jgi:predicted RNase H-like HicB family nuclease
MTPLSIALRIVCFREGDAWFAHCLEFDLIGDGPTKAEALEELADAIRIQIEFSIEHGNVSNLFSPADGDLFLKFAAGKKSEFAAGALLMQIEPITIDAVEIHELEEVLAAA